MIKYQGISTLEVLKEAKNYNKWIAEEITKHIVSPTIEIGAGTGNLTKYFLFTKKFYITEKDSGLVKKLKKTFSQEKNILVEKLDITQRIPKKFLSFFSTVFAVNVLEHIEDDETALKNAGQLLKKGGRLLILVPAKQFAYTKLDKDLGHFRRYEKAELTTKIKTAGFTIEKIYFFNIVGLLSWYVRDKVKRGNIQLKPHHIALFDFVVPLLKIIESKIPVPVGISLIAVAKKR